MSLVSYSSYKNNISIFNSEEYLKNQIESDSFDLFLDFIQKYREIESEDLKKPIFSQTTKFKKNPNNFKHYKNLKILRDKDKDENKNGWTFQTPVEENTKISVLIKSFLNKISNDNYNQVSVEFIDEILKIKNNNLFQIICDEIYNKCIFESKYRNLYINLCSKIWNNRIIHYNLTNIILHDNNYYWTYIGDTKKYGPFSNEINTKNDIYQKSSFKKYFLNYIQKLYINKNLSFDSLDEDEMYYQKKKVLLLVELIGLMYIEKYINFDISNIIIIDLLHINKFDKIKDIEYELLFNLLKIIKDNKTNYTSLNEYKYIFNEYITNLNSIIMNLSKQSGDKELFSGTIVKENTMNLSKRSGDKELFSGTIVKENTMNLSKRSGDKELFSGTIVKENTMNLSKRSGDKELFSGTIVKENTMNLSKRSGDKELFSGTIVKENTSNNYSDEKFDISKRSLFFINEILNILNIFVENKKNDDTNQNNKKIFINKLNNFNNTDINNMISIYNSYSKNEKIDILYSIIDKYISEKNKNDNIILLLKEIKDINNYYEVLDKYTENIKDILLDIPNATIKIIQLIELLNYDKNKSNKYIQIFKNITLDDESSDNESSNNESSDNESSDDD